MAAPDLVASDKLRGPEPSVRRSPYAVPDGLLLYGTFALLMFGPLAFGAVQPWAIYTLEAATAVLGILWASRNVMAREWEIVVNPVFAPMLGFAVVVASQLILGTTVYRHATEAGASLYFCYGLLAFLVTQALRRSSQVKRVAAVLTAYGAAVAIFALVQSLSSDGKLYWVREPQGGGAIYGPYVNRNHYAGLMEMLIPVAIAAVLSNHVRRKWRPWFACAAVLMAGTIFLSGSRGGMLAFLVQMALLGLVLGINRNRRAAWITASILAAILGLALWVGGQPMVARVLSIHGEAQAELDGGLRLRVDRDSLKMFGRKPVLGWGLGSFGEVYPKFRSFATDKIIDQAHNDYVQLLVETGILGFATGAWFIILVFRRGIGKLSNWAWDMNGTVALAALLASAGILVHGWVDFNLQIPANAALFYTLCAVAAAPTRFGSQRAHPPLSRRA